MQIQVTHKTVYGNELFYPANELAKTLTDWKGAKSFTQSDMQYFTNRGFKVEVVHSGGITQMLEPRPTTNEGG